HKNVYVERAGKLDRLPTTFQDDKHLMRVIDRIVSGVGRRVDDSSPMVDARLPDGSRVNAIIPPLAVDGPLLSIRRFPAERLKADDLVTLKALTRPMLDFLSHCVRSRLNCLISGGTGAGKTTLLNVLSSYIGDTERIVTMQEIFTFEKVGLTQEGKVVGRFRATGVRPKVCERLKACGIHLPGDMFEGVTEIR